VKSNELLKTLQNKGCYFVRQAKGSHEWWYSPITQQHFLVTNHGSKEVAKGTENRIKKLAGIK
jgi:predicted RNA binding protein YcfA (HicA-like mRNA interferase family)